MYMLLFSKIFAYFSYRNITERSFKWYVFHNEKHHYSVSVSIKWADGTISVFPYKEHESTYLITLTQLCELCFNIFVLQMRKLVLRYIKEEVNIIKYK